MESTPTLKAPRGFTIIELLVVAAIIGVLTTILVLTQSSFNRSILLTDTAYTLALSVREAQSFGLSSRKFGIVQNTGYGLHFTSGSPTNYIIFADTTPGASYINPACPLGTPGRPDAKPGDCRYTAGQDGILTTYSLNRGFVINNICASTNTWGRICSVGGGSLISNMDVVFTRPNTATAITVDVGSGGSAISGAASCAEVDLTDQSGQVTKQVRITNLGQVSVGQTCP